MSIPDHFRALIISEPKDGGRATGKFATISRDALPTQGEVLVQVFFSSLNDKDALAVEFLAAYRQPLGSERWAGAIDSVGGDVLSSLLSDMTYRSGVACCGLARAGEFSATVFPFILRGVRLIGIDSVYCPPEERRLAWEEIGKTRPLKGLEEITAFYSLVEVPELAQALLDGKLRGRSLITIAGKERALVQCLMKGELNAY